MKEARSQAIIIRRFYDESPSSWKRRVSILFQRETKNWQVMNFAAVVMVDQVT